MSCQCRGQNNGVKIYCQRAEPGSAGWQLRADRWPGTQGSPVFILMNVCDFPGPHHYSELCGFCSTWKSLLGISLYGDTSRLIPKLSRNEWYALHASGLLLDKRTWLLRTEDKMNYIMYTWSYIKRRIFGKFIFETLLNGISYRLLVTWFNLSVVDF